MLFYHNLIVFWLGIWKSRLYHIIGTKSAVDYMAEAEQESDFGLKIFLQPFCCSFWKVNLTTQIKTTIKLSIWTTSKESIQIFYLICNSLIRHPGILIFIRGLIELENLFGNPSLNPHLWLSITLNMVRESHFEWVLTSTF